MMDKKICLLLAMLLVIVLQTIAAETYSGKGSSALDRKEAAKNDRYEDEADGKADQDEDELATPTPPRRSRLPGQGSSAGRSRSRWPSTDDFLDGNDWGRSSANGYNEMFSGLNGFFDHGQPENAPTCHSILDPQFTLFSDICGVMPQARYSLPNYFGHVERWQIAQTLTTLLGHSNPTLSNRMCSRSLKLLICPLLFPPCKSSRRESLPVLPCQPFCRAVKSQCPSPSLDLLPCDFLPPTSELCPVNPTPYSSLLSSFGTSFPMGSTLSSTGFGSSPLSSLLAQSAFANNFSPMGTFGTTSFQMPSFASTGFGTFNFPTANLQAQTQAQGQAQGQTQGQTFGITGFPQFLYPIQSTQLPTQTAFQNNLTPSQSTAAAAAASAKEGVNAFSSQQYPTQGIPPMMVDFSQFNTIPDIRQNGRFFPSLRSTAEKS